MTKTEEAIIKEVNDTPAGYFSNFTVIRGIVMEKPTLRKTRKGVDVTNFRLATKTAYRYVRDGVPHVGSFITFHDCVAWGDLARKSAQYNPGDMMELVGFLKVMKKEKDGETFMNREIQATAILEVVED